MNKSMEHQLRTLLHRIREQVPGATNLHLSLTLPGEAFDELCASYVENLADKYGNFHFEVGSYPSSLSVSIRREGSVKVATTDEYIQYMRSRLLESVLDDTLMTLEERMRPRVERQVQIRGLAEKLIPDQDIVLSLVEEGYPDIDPMNEGMFTNGDEIAEEIAELVRVAMQR